MRGLVGPTGSPPVRAAFIGAASAVAISAAAGAVVMGGAGKRFVFVPTVTAQPTPWNRDVLALCPKLHAPYHLSPFLRNGHVETIFAAWFRRDPRLVYTRELVRMPDGGTVALDTERGETSSQLPSDAPVLILLPGLTGGSDDTYVQHAVLHAKAAGIRAVVFNSRGTSESPVTTPQFYSASFTQDLRHVVGHVAVKYPGVPLFAAGWSLGANILTRYLGEEGGATPLTAAIAMCNPFNLPLSDANFKRGFNKIYDWNLARSLRKIYSKHRSLFEEAASSGVKAYDTERALKAATIRDFDDAITRIAFGWSSVDAYYEGSSSSTLIPKVEIPLLVIQAEDDPIAPKEAVPYSLLRDNHHCILVTTPTGGHLGWCSGPQGPRGAPWTDAVVTEYLEAVLKISGGGKVSKEAAEEPAGVWTTMTTTHQTP